MNLLKAERKVRVRSIATVDTWIATFLDAAENENGYLERSVVVVVVKVTPPTPLIILLPRLATLDEVWWSLLIGVATSLDSELILITLSSSCLQQPEMTSQFFNSSSNANSIKWNFFGETVFSCNLSGVVFKKFSFLS